MKTPAANSNAVEQLVGLLNEVKDYIACAEEKIDGEWGACRSAQTMIEAHDMPDVYWKVAQAIEDNTRLDRQDEAL